MLQTGNSSGAALFEAAETLRKARNIVILIHMSPDGDAIGSSKALRLAVEKLGKKARVLCSDPIPAKYDYLPPEPPEEPMGEPDLIMALDLADEKLFGEKLRPYLGRVQLCIDHHFSNMHYAGMTALFPEAAATCEIMAGLLKVLNVEIDKDIANCIYTGMATDTGCFRYSNTRPNTLRTAADMMEKGAEAAKINKLLFETDTKERLELEKRAMETLEYDYDGRVALIYITLDMLRGSGADDGELEGIASMPIRIKGVKAGITIKEKSPGVYKISVRTTDDVDASAICGALGGGGHRAAAGCQCEGTLAQAKAAILAAAGKGLENDA